jgi:hypothetical protein
MALQRPAPAVLNPWFRPRRRSNGYAPPTSRVELPKGDGYKSGCPVVLICGPAVRAKPTKPRDLVKRPKPTTPSVTYREWLQKAGAPAEGSPHMRPRDWRDLFIAGATPEQAAENAERNRYNREVAPALRGKRR